MPSQMWRWGTSSTAPTRKRARPWLLLSAPLMALTGILLFTVPNGSETVQAVWVMVSYNLFYSFAYTIFNMSHSLMVPLSTRDTGQRGGLSVFNQITTIMMSGILVALIFLRIIMPAIGVDKGRWITLMSILSVLALPLTLLEYYFTKERVTEEVENAGTESVAFARQLGAIFSDRYMILIYAYFLISAVGACIKNISLVYFCNYVLGSYNDGITQTMISVIGGIPMGSQNCSSRKPESQNCSSREPESQNCPSREPEALHRPLRELKGFRNMYKAVEATIAKGFGGKADYENPEFRMMMASSAGSPLRSMQISGGMKGGLLPGMLEIANGHFFRGLWKMIKG